MLPISLNFLLLEVFRNVLDHLQLKSRRKLNEIHTKYGKNKLIPLSNNCCEEGDKLFI